MAKKKPKHKKDHQRILREKLQAKQQQGISRQQQGIPKSEAQPQSTPREVVYEDHAELEDRTVLLPGQEDPYVRSGRNVLSKQEMDLMYSAYLPLIQFVDNCLNHVSNRGYGPIRLRQSFINNTARRLDATDYVWSHPDIIDRYLERVPNLPKAERQLVTGWKQAMPGIYVVVDYGTTDGAILVGLDNKAYRVCGVMSTVRDMLRGAPLPATVKTTLLPFNGRIITDGLMSLIPMVMEQELAQRIIQDWKTSAAQGTILTSIPVESES